MGQLEGYVHILFMLGSSLKLKTTTLANQVGMTLTMASTGFVGTGLLSASVIKHPLGG